MKLNKKKLDALNVLLWCLLTMASLVALMLTHKDAFGFCSLFCLIWFLYEDYDYKQKYPKKEEEQ